MADDPHPFFRTSREQVEHAKRVHGDNAKVTLAAECADVIAETIGCPDCRHAAPDMIWNMMDSASAELRVLIVTSLATSLAKADRDIAYGQAAYDSLSEEDKARVAEMSRG